MPNAEFLQPAVLLTTGWRFFIRDISTIDAQA